MQNIGLKVNNLANEANIDLSTVEIKFLDEKQDIIFKRVECLQSEINRLYPNDSSNVKQLHNITICVNSSKPPLSVLLLLTLLKNRGYKVACQSYCAKGNQSAVQTKISEYLKKNFNIIGGRLNYDLIVSFIWKDMGISEVFCFDQILDNVPLIGEMTVLVYICYLLNVDYLPFMDKVECLNNDLMYKHNIKGALNLLNNKLVNDINNNNASNSFLSAFAISCIFQSTIMGKVSQSLKTNIANVLNDCGHDINEICGLFGSL